MPFAWVTADSVYGADHALRRWLQEHRLGYVLAVTRAQRLGLGPRRGSCGRDTGHYLASPQRRQRGEGATALRLAYLPYGADAAPGCEKVLLIRRSIAQPHELAFYLTHAADGTRSPTSSGRQPRWAIEACFEAAKGEVGLDQYEVRSWAGWHRHVTLAMLAHAYLTALRKVVVGGRAHLDLAADLLPLTVPEVRRLLWHLLLRPSCPGVLGVVAKVAAAAVAVVAFLVEPPVSLQG